MQTEGGRGVTEKICISCFLSLMRVNVEIYDSVDITLTSCLAMYYTVGNFQIKLILKCQVNVTKGTLTVLQVYMTYNVR
jgi:hypothetical protein